MSFENLEATAGLAQRVERNVRQTAYGRIRNLAVEVIRGQVVVSGQAPSRHVKQLALHGALELLSSDCFAERITIG
jgi:hypothetical protein